jgi:hypothetical protein
MIGAITAGLLGGGAPPAFNPTSIAGCQLWLDASDTATISVSATLVSQWNDKSGNSRNFTQATTLNKPLSGTRTQNGLNLIDFDGTDDRLVSSSATSTWTFLHDGTQYTVFLALVKDLDAFGDALGNNGNASASTGAVFSEANSLRLGHYVSRGVSGTAVIDNITGNNVVSGFHYWSTQAKPSDGTAANRSEMKYKAGSAIRNNGQTGAVNTGSATYDLTIGDSKGNTTNLPFNGGIGEIIIYNSYLNSTDLGTVNSYLATKWGV